MISISIGFEFITIVSFIMVIQQLIIMYIFAFSFLPYFSFSLRNCVPSAKSLTDCSSYSNSMTDDRSMIYIKSPYGYGNYNSRYQMKLFAKKQTAQQAPKKKNSGGLKFNSIVTFS